MYDGRRRGWTQKAVAENSPYKHKDGLGYFFRFPSRGAKVGGEAALLLCLPSCGAKVEEWVALSHFRLRFVPGQHTRRTRPQRPLHGAQPASFGRAGPGWYLGPRRLRFRGRAGVAREPLAAARGADSGKQVSGGRAVLVVRLRCAIRRPGRRPARGDVIGGDSPVAFGRHWVLVIPGR